MEWKQTLQDVDLTIPVGDLKSRDLKIEIKKNSISVKTNTKDLLVGDLSKDVKVQDSTWFLDSGILNIHLEKVNQMEWWKHVLTTDPEIDTSKIEPENSKLSDLDGETRGMVEKMMYDQRQKELGKPTSEEQQKLKVFENFKKQHPELDFSQAKLN